MKFMSIKTKLVTAIGICFFVVITALTVYSSITKRKDSIDSAKENAMATAQKFAGYIQTEIESALNTGRILAQTLSAVKDVDSPLDIGRDQVNSILRTVLEENESFLGTYTLWEPDAFDQMDSSYANLEGHDKTGRFIPYWTRGPNGIVMEPLMDYEKEGIGDYYQIPKRTKKEVINEPYIYPVQGREVLITSLVVPIIYEGQFYGIAGVDILLETLQDMVNDIRLYDGKAELIIFSNKGQIVAASGRPELQGKGMEMIHKDRDEDGKYISRGQSVIEDDEGRFALFAPIRIGKTETPWSVNINIPYETILADAQTHTWNAVAIGVGLSILSLVIIYFIIAKVVSPLLSLTAIAEKIAVGNLDYEEIQTADDEIGRVSGAFGQVTSSLREITSICQGIAFGDLTQSANVRSEYDTLSKSINQMSGTLRSVVEQANSIAQGDYSKEVTLRSETDELGIALSQMTEQLRETTEENKQQNWLKTGQGKLYDNIRGEQSTIQLSQNIIEQLSAYLGAQIGAIYLSQEDNDLKMVGSYAYTRRKGISNQMTVGQGLVGQAVLEKKTMIVTDVPDDYIAVQSGLGNAVPRNIMIVPFQYEGRVIGVLELGSFREFDDLQLEFLEKASESIAIAVNGAKSRAKMSELLEETQRQSEELQNQQDELKATNEELEQQTEHLRNSEQVLKAQQEELEVANSELEDKTDVLEEQKEKLEQSWQQVKLKSRELELANKYKSEFLSNMSHELRTPLNSLLILSKMLMDNSEGNLTDEQVESSKVIYEGGTDLLSLINEILDLSKIEAGKMEINIDELSLQDMINDVEKNFHHVAVKKNLELKTKIDANLPECIRTDGKRVSQVIKNLLSNALKFTEQGSVTVSITRPESSIDLSHSGLDHNNAIAFSISDTGIGISDDKKQVIFQAFQQADGTIDRKYGGTGLGLSISKEIAKLLGGEIQLQSEHGKGSTFTMYLPEVSINISDDTTETLSGDVTSRPQIETPAETKDQVSPSIQHDLKVVPDDRDDIGDDDKVILIVEDDWKFAKILVDMSHDKNFKCLVASSGETGIKLAADYQPDAIILDVGLPGIDGFAVIDTLKDNSATRHIPVHFMSARDEKQSETKALSMGAIGYMTKPVSKQLLDDAFDSIGEFISSDIKKLLIAEDDVNARESIIKLIGSDDIEITAVGTGKEAYDLLKKQKFDCMVLDLGLPDISGFELLNQMKNDDAVAAKPPVVVYSGQDLSRDEVMELREYAGSVIIKGAESPERLMDETSLFLHRMEKSLPQEQQRILRMAHEKETILHDKKVLVVDDDMRNIFALSHALKAKGMNVVRAENGQKALEMLDTHDDIDVVLMDIMMPIMDGYEAMRNIRKQEKFWKLPILALTAKAMKDDRQKCIEAGANDYLAKPIDIEKVLSMLRVWLYV